MHYSVFLCTCAMIMWSVKNRSHYSSESTDRWWQFVVFFSDISPIIEHCSRCVVCYLAKFS